MTGSTLDRVLEVDEHEDWRSPLIKWLQEPVAAELASELPAKGSSCSSTGLEPSTYGVLFSDPEKLIVMEGVYLEHLRQAGQQTGWPGRQCSRQAAMVEQSSRCA
ncbi:RING/U-box protein with C6HC-type zinc finger [Striga asiatica]|uniref:RING/U-box protein with C6HC-type zinc finger n=1 Tax=Striga asiatica TaxID=4170 RepID=A0A5A7Q874_STRAF|nr:RING/U-box protein with C6HC-type zinc finger [Striga asiatica]